VLEFPFTDSPRPPLSVADLQLTLGPPVPDVPDVVAVVHAPGGGGIGTPDVDPA
jgi:hypothetical protein